MTVRYHWLVTNGESSLVSCETTYAIALRHAPTNAVRELVLAPALAQFVREHADLPTAQILIGQLDHLTPDMERKYMTQAATALVDGRQLNINDLMRQYGKQIAAVLPKHLTQERVARLALICVRRTPELMQCHPLTVFGGILQAAQCGLELGHNAYLVPFKNKHNGNRLEAQFIPKYTGLMDLCRRSGEIGAFDAQAVCQGDYFDFELGLNPTMEHKPARKRGALTHVYAFAKDKRGTLLRIEVMNREEVEAIRARSGAPNSPAWSKDYNAMAIKTVIRRISKYLPQSIELQTAVALDTLADAGKSQRNELVFDADGWTPDVDPEAPTHSDPPAGSARKPSPRGPKAAGKDEPALVHEPSPATEAPTAADKAAVAEFWEGVPDPDGASAQP